MAGVAEYGVEFIDLGTGRRKRKMFASDEARAGWVARHDEEIDVLAWSDPRSDES